MYTSNNVRVIDIADNVLDVYKHLQSNKPILTKFMDLGEFVKKGYRINSNKEVTMKLNLFINLIIQTTKAFHITNCRKRTEILSVSINY